MTAVQVRVPATCGELLQGVDDAGPVLVSLPIGVTGSVHIRLTREPILSVDPDLPKSRAALQLAIERAGWPGGATVRLGGEIPRSRGMGSSTADVAGIIAGVCAAAEVGLAGEELIRLATQVEPSDSSPLPGLWAIDHVRGLRAAQLAPVAPDWWLVAVDSGVAVPTLDVHRRCGAGPRIPPHLVRRTSWSDPAALARVATESALRNQERLPHPALETVLRCVARHGALGVCVAHSGSLCAAICTGSRQADAARTALAAEGLDADVLQASGPGIQVLRETAVPI